MDLSLMAISCLPTSFDLAAVATPARSGGDTMALLAVQ